MYRTLGPAMLSHWKRWGPQKTWVGWQNAPPAPETNKWSKPPKGGTPAGSDDGGGDDGGGGGGAARVAAARGAGEAAAGAAGAGASILVCLA